MVLCKKLFGCNDILIHIADMFRHIFFFVGNLRFRDNYKNRYLE